MAFIFLIGDLDPYTMKTFNKGIHIQHGRVWPTGLHTRRHYQLDDLMNGMNTSAYWVGEHQKAHIPNEAPSTVLRA
ncbi:hypothetical protein E6O75_ATG03243 [Venturia nashicola]|uniref:Uncharacterized protein n=1 Tax=Venturia nashicola TaxID=86259 RepID=A0A4Z1P477_9PEZI|nr:hypothetical protein E6O75_ATG03243 [Venturia nashicola]